jgi:hypothetical protein
MLFTKLLFVCASAVHVPLELQREETELTDSNELHSTSRQATSLYSSMNSGRSSRSTTSHSASFNAAGSSDKSKHLYINASFAEQPGKPRSSTSSSRSSRYGSSPYSSGGHGSKGFSSGGKRSSLSGHSKPSGLKSVAEKKDSWVSGSKGFPHLLLILLMVFTAVGVGVGVWAGVTDILGKQQRAAEAAAAAAAVALDLQGAAGGAAADAGLLRFRTVMDVPSSMPANASCSQWFGGSEVSLLLTQPI